VSLTSGSGPLGLQPAGRFDFERPPTVVYVEPLARRVRGRIGGRTVVDSSSALLVHRSGVAPTYALPADHVDVPTAVPEPAAPGHVLVPWDDVEEWFEEDQQVFLHAINPYHRVECLPTSRQVRVSIGGVVLVDTTAALAVYETALPPRWYVAPDDVRMDVLERSDTTSFCPYKGTATYWSARIDGVLTPDVAWSYDDPLRESERIARHLAFYDERVAVEVGSGPPPTRF
jgi:uncharacterized protein (DUF427 family)